MDVRREVDDIVRDAGSVEASEVDVIPNEALRSATEEVSKLLALTNDSLKEICNNIEGATSRESCREGFRRFNEVIRMFLVSAPDPDDDNQVCSAIISLGPSARLRSLLEGQSSVEVAITAYKTLILQNLAASLSQSTAVRAVSEEQDDDLFDQFFAQQPVEAVDQQADLGGQDWGVAQEAVSSRALKRSSRHLADDSPAEVVPKKKRSTIPALASLSELSRGDDLCNTAKKRTLLTREKLRAAMHDPKGLLDLAGPSTSALDRTKELELLKSAGYDFTNKSKSFSDRLNAATLRLELGLGGHSTSDTLLFGASVLNLPGFLARKNISDVENNGVHGSTTWKHQDAYAKMVIAGCLAQAKKIFEKFDEVLYGPAPEKLVEESHAAIADLLMSEDAKVFKEGVDEGVADDNTNRELFIKRIIEAVAPILPITIRNKSLDGCYLRTALHLLGAAELVFAQYISDIRTQSNPAGVVGVCNAMHAQLKKSAVLSDGLRPPHEFLREMKSLYQTCLGLGSSFPNDNTVRGNRRGRGNQSRRGRSWRRSEAVGDFGGRSPGTTHPSSYNSYIGSAVREASGRGGVNSYSSRGRNECFDFQRGTCRRGGACRFLHTSQ